MEVEGPSFSLAVRVCGSLCFLAINPLFIWIWIDDPKFVQGSIDFPELFMGVVTAGMLLLGLLGLRMGFAKTRVTEKTIQWGLFQRRELALDRIRGVKVIFSSHGTTFIQLLDQDGRRHEISGATPELRQAFIRMQTN